MRLLGNLLTAAVLIGSVTAPAPAEDWASRGSHAADAEERQTNERDWDSREPDGPTATKRPNDSHNQLRGGSDESDDWPDEEPGGDAGTAGRAPAPR